MRVNIMRKFQIKRIYREKDCDSSVGSFPFAFVSTMYWGAI